MGSCPNAVGAPVLAHANLQPQTKKGLHSRLNRLRTMQVHSQLLELFSMRFATSLVDLQMS